MALPSIPTYPLPRAEELPAGRVSWRFDADRAVLLVHDMQRYFLDAYTEEFTALYEGIAALRGLRLPTFYTAQVAPQVPETRGLLTDMWGPGIQDRAEIVAPLSPVEGDVVLDKHRYSAFVRSDLAERMRAMGRDQIVLCGVYAHIGVLTTALDAFGHDFKPFFVADAMADFSREKHLTALSIVASCAGVVTTVAALTAITLDQVRAAVLAHLEEEVGDEEDLVEAGLDSIRVMALVEEWKKRGHTVGFADLAADPTIAGFHRALTKGNT